MCAIILSLHVGSTFAQGTIKHIRLDFEQFESGTELRNQLASEGLYFSSGVIAPGITAGSGESIGMDGNAGPKFLLLNGPLTIRSDYPIIGVSQFMASPRSSDYVYQEFFQSVHWDWGGTWAFAGSGNFGESSEVHYNAYSLRDGIPVQSLYGIDDLRFALLVPEPRTSVLLGFCFVAHLISRWVKARVHETE